MFKENANPFNVLRGIDWSKVHGHTKIILKSVKTGEENVIEHDNTFQTSVCEKYIDHRGMYNSRDGWGNWEPWRCFAGGILLFKDPIDISNGAVPFMPKGNKMVANGSYNITNAGTPVELGSFNPIESSLDGNTSKTFVYDWGTSQGNGTISCVSLTHEYGGYTGYGNPSGLFASTLRKLYDSQSYPMYSTSYDYGQGEGIFGYYDDKILAASVDIANSKVTICERPLSMKKTSLFYPRNGASASESWRKQTEYTFSGDITNGLSASAVRLVAWIDDGKMYLFPCSRDNAISIANGSAYAFLVYNIANGTVARQTITNNTGYGWIIGGVASGSSTSQDRSINGNYVPRVIDGIFYVHGVRSGQTQYTYFSVNMSTGALIERYDNVGTQMNALGVDLLCYDGYSNDKPLIVVDTTNGTKYPTNGYVLEGSGHATQRNVALEQMYGNAGYNSVGWLKNYLFLTTVNNLQTAVTKDNTQTMKVIYTLTEQ